VRRDRELITAQNPASDDEFARTFVRALLERAPLDMPAKN
jgi:putative intracellular protease/amidase